jgi:acyl-CoA dehydrogenase
MALDVRGGDAAFLTEVRAFFDQALTPDLREAGRNTLGVHSDITACRIWHKRLYARGWIAPAWPVEWGGAGWSVRQRFLFERECAANDAPVLFAGGLRSLGPLLIEMGTPDQRARYIPAILSGQDFWCQGFSEPGAGSDLAAVQTHAVRNGDHYVVDGAKIWTTGAHLSNRMFAIVRTQRRPRRQEGLTFLLIDMDTPGVRVTPILDLNGSHEFNHVFFENVQVPVANRVGAEDDGWTVAKRLMQLARSNNTPSALVRRTLRRTAVVAAEAGLLDEPAIATQFAALSIELEAFARFELASLPSGRPSAGVECTPSMLKLIGTELLQRVTALALEIAAPHGAAAHDTHTQDAAAHATARYFAARAATIYSGSSETQRNILARSLLS